MTDISSRAEKMWRIKRRRERRARLTETEKKLSNKLRGNGKAFLANYQEAYLAVKSHTPMDDVKFKSFTEMYEVNIVTHDNTEHTITCARTVLFTEMHDKRWVETTCLSNWLASVIIQRWWRKLQKLGHHVPSPTRHADVMITPLELYSGNEDELAAWNVNRKQVRRGRHFVSSEELTHEIKMRHKLSRKKRQSVHLDLGEAIMMAELVHLGHETKEEVEALFTMDSPVVYQDDSDDDDEYEEEEAEKRLDSTLDTTTTSTAVTISNVSVNPDQSPAAATSPSFVMAIRQYKARKPQQMSFAKGDVIRVVRTKGQWHEGVLYKSSTFPVDNKTTLFYPSNLVQPYDATAANSDTNTGEQGNDNPTNEVSRDDTAVVDDAKVVKVVKVVALRECKATKPIQMSFAKGDIIRVLDSKNTWHKGVLVQSSSYPINDKPLFFPPNFVRAVVEPGNSD